MIRKMWSVLHL